MPSPESGRPIDIGNHPIPHSVKEPHGKFSYVEPGNAKFDLSRGESPFGVLDDLQERYIDKIRDTSFKNRLEHYSNENDQVVVSYIRERFGLSDSPHIVVKEGASQVILRDIIRDWINSPHSPPAINKPDLRTQFIAVSPHFHEVERFVTGNKIQNIAYSPSYGDGPSSLDMTLDESLQLVIDRNVHERRNRVFFANIPDSPKGDFASQEMRLKFIEFATENALGIIDEAVGDTFPDSESAIPLTERFPNLVVVRSASKVLGAPNSRIGYAVMSENLRESFISAGLDYNLSLQTALLAEVLLEPKRTRQLIERVGPEISRVKKAFREGLVKEGWHVYPTSDLTQILLIDGGFEDFYNQALKYGVKGAKGSGWHKTQPYLSDRQIRLNIPERVEDIPDILTRLNLARNSGYASD